MRYVADFDLPGDMILLNKRHLAQLLVRMDLQDTPLRALHDPEHRDHNLATLYNTLLESCLPYLEDGEEFPQLGPTQLIMTALGHKIQVIKCIRNHTGTGLKEAKYLSETACPVVMTLDVPGSPNFWTPERIQDYADGLRVAGATVELK
jgi:hypothetical protein